LKKVQSHSRAFTLAELMVAVSIIAVLMSVLIPALSKTREVARNVRCQANLRQFGTAIQLFADDHRGKMMPMDTALDVGWYNVLRPYIGKSGYADDATESAAQNIGLCPVTETPEWAGDRYYQFGDAYTAWTWQYDTGSYGMNNWFNPDGDAYYATTGGQIFDPVRDQFFERLSSPQFPAETPVVGDCNWVGGWPEPFDGVVANLVKGGFGHGRGHFMKRFAIIRHFERSVNLVYVDGHVDSVVLGDLWQQNWHAKWVDPAPRTLP
jgi:prepilin-type N-terminal cleavage/methylation domain-containing protein/prepilin-type processing-associated H-X9-DG protein